MLLILIIIIDGCLLMQLLVFVHNAIHSNMYFVINANVNSYYNKLNVKVLEIVFGHLLEQTLEHVQLWHALIILYNNNVHKLKDVIGILLHNLLEHVHLILVAVIYQVKMHRYVLHYLFIVQDQMELFVNLNNN